ncbi:hypothetical protein Dimus_027449 [Dionaea muscipula]
MDGGREGHESAKEVILRWDSTVSDSSRDGIIFSGADRGEADRYLSAVDEIQRSFESASISDERILEIAMARLEDEFRRILITRSTPIDTDSLADHHSASSSRRCSVELDDAGAASSSAGAGGDEGSSSSAAAGGDEVSRDDGALTSVDSLDRSFEIDASRSSYRSVSSINEIDLLPAEAIHDLRRIAERMIAAGYQRECIQVYASVRRSNLDENFRRLGIERRSIGEFNRLEWGVLDHKISQWIPAAKIFVRTVFASEKRLSEQIFEGLGDASIDDACFLETVKSPAGQLFVLADAISIGQRSVERLFKVVDLHDVFVEILPDIEIVFKSNAMEPIRTQAQEILWRLAEAVRGILSEFENAVLLDSSRAPVPGGRIHPLTRYVMNYLNLICDYKDSLMDIILFKPSPRHDDNNNNNTAMPMPEMDFEKFQDRTPLALHLIWSVVILVFKVDEKSLLYEDASLAHLFRVNNFHYIVEKAKKSPEMLGMIGDDYLRRLKWKCTEGVTDYVRETWLDVMHFLRDEGLSVRAAEFRSMLKERFKGFNAKFDEVHKTQAMWFVHDPQLREEIRISLTVMLIPGYRSFLGRYGSHLEGVRHYEAYIKYSVEDLETAVLDLFEGKPVTQKHLWKCRNL